MTTQPRSPKHRTKVRHRHGLWIAACSCGWSEVTVASFSAWLAERRHQERAGDRLKVRQAQT